MQKSLLFTYFLINLSMASLGNTILDIKNPDDKYNVSGCLYFFEDKNQSFNFEDVSAAGFRGNFTLLPNDVRSFGNTRSSFWFKFDVINNTDIQNWLFYADYPVLNHVAFHLVNKSGVLEESIISGLDYPSLKKWAQSYCYSRFQSKNWR
jgi:hypothetical protein